MKREVAEKWVDALESGNYLKTKNTLKDETGYCCLGVFCDVFKDEIEKNTSEKIVVFSNGKMCIERKNLLGNLVQEETQLTSPIAYYYDMEYEDQMHLAELNDNTEDFKEVIRMIKQFYYGEKDAS